MRSLILDGFIEMVGQFLMSSTKSDVAGTETKWDLSRFEVTLRPIKVTGWFPKNCVRSFGSPQPKFCTSKANNIDSRAALQIKETKSKVSWVTVHRFALYLSQFF